MVTVALKRLRSNCAETLKLNCCRGGGCRKNCSSSSDSTESFDDNPFGEVLQRCRLSVDDTQPVTVDSVWYSDDVNTVMFTVWCSNKFAVGKVFFWLKFTCCSVNNLKIPTFISAHGAISTGVSVWAAAAFLGARWCGELLPELLIVHNSSHYSHESINYSRCWFYSNAPDKSTVWPCAATCDSQLPK